MQILPPADAPAGSSVQLVDTGALGDQALHEISRHRRVAVHCEGGHPSVSVTGRICLVQVCLVFTCPALQTGAD